MKASGKFVLRVNPALHSALRLLAMASGQSLNQICVSLLSDGLKKKRQDEPTLKLLQKQFGDRLVGMVLFGSEARGEVRESSDRDLLLVMHTSVPINSTLYREWEKSIASQVDQKTSPHFVHLPDSAANLGSLWLEVALDGKVLFDPDNLITALLSKARELIASHFYRRKLSHGHPYWIREE